jgi:type II secretory pathway pseudopilin PulG
MTLIELVLVATILLVIAGVASVALGSGLGQDRHTVAARELAATLRATAERAALSGLRQRVLLSLASGEVVVEQEADPYDAPGVWSAAAGSWGRRRSLPNGVRWGAVTIAGDGAAWQTIEPAALANLELVFAPDGVMQLAGEEAEQVFSPFPDEGELVELELLAAASTTEPLIVRVEATGDIRVWTASEREAHRDSLATAEGIK